ncbi:hypothetical protein B4135_3493 [Caldibacillus debilis]|uniref:Uncharacterized protein n=1 Tax=Caldibacillus debilis TaxID=301148 RepID=A0A150LDA4_9BACI|nr:hypothetical protein B4135_3493 [Caldibacillus debilis]
MPSAGRDRSPLLLGFLAGGREAERLPGVSGTGGFDRRGKSFKD